MRLKIPFKFKNIKTTSERVRFDFAGHIFNIEVEYLPFRLHHNGVEAGDLKKEDGIFYMNFYNEEGELVEAGRAISHYVDLSDMYKRKMDIEEGFKIMCIPVSQKAFKAGEVTYETITSGASILAVV
ncbi:hypothetical protein PM10SUCC1_32310 [Propionigenium maris DSM 9537]|uniref:Uncharacterized protein n=1 Tax=Propionigenium maris DSM 9537 TaxID=1123000 RepID=A0A9W6GPV1_9FUSO|nr:hypothetical protein [Propionigenium maris]GLI57717.1 hypothetical protein PM10SUCC1_32310 [Propionigenium maris DSM 9537]